MRYAWQLAPEGIERIRPVAEISWLWMVPGLQRADIHLQSL